MVEFNKEENLYELLASSKVVILQFGNESCAPCAAIKERIDEWSSAHEEVVTRYISLEDFPGLAAEYGIFSVPTVLVFVNEELTIRESGYFSLEDILRRTERYLDLLDEA